MNNWKTYASNLSEHVDNGFDELDFIQAEAEQAEKEGRDLNEDGFSEKGLEAYWDGLAEDALNESEALNITPAQYLAGKWSESRILKQIEDNGW